MIIYHNPRCSKSRQALALCKEHGVEPEIVDYQKQPPSLDALQEILEGLDGDIDLMTRTNELKKAGLVASLELLVQRPEFLQRPILVKPGRVAVARTPDAVSEFLES